jgi:hypothetical protein
VPACPQCHTELDPGWEQCEHCGYRPTGHEWEGQLGEPAGAAPGVGAPRWGAAPASTTNGNGHAHAPGHSHAPPPARNRGMRWVLVAAAIGLVVLVAVLVALL